MRFEWNQAKAVLNERKHGVTFEEAISVFHDEQAVQFYDSEETAALSEDRYLLLGLSSNLRILMISHCERDNGNAIRIISARKATRKESEHYPVAL